MIRIWLFSLAVIAVASPASALSCLRPDAVRLLEMARDAEESYYLIRGRIDLSEAPVEPVPGSEESAITAARISGTALGSYSFSNEVVLDILIEAHCLGPWCGSANDPNGEVFAALRIDEDKLYLSVGPCGGDIVNWSRDGERRLLTCHRNGSCETQDF